ncbi:MAG: hypothetical protein HFF18_09860 [Oscillospiraceae bacterium]|nr:hypothetical protein [Oscillospiraceae bacterium]
MNYTIRTPEGVQTLTDGEISAKAKAFAEACPSEITCAFRVWYEGFEGYGMPAKGVVSAIEQGIASSAQWTCVGPRRFEKYGLVNAYENQNYQNAAKELNGHPMILHRFRSGGKYQGPDGKVWWIPVVEQFDMRCFEYQDGKYVGTMTEINPNSDYAKAMVEVK